MALTLTTTTATRRPRPSRPARRAGRPRRTDRIRGGRGRDALDADISAVTTAAGFEGKPGQSVLVPSAGRLGADAVLLLGVGDPDSVTLEGLRRAGAALARVVHQGAHRRDHVGRRGAVGHGRRSRSGGASPRACSSVRTSSSNTSRSPPRRRCAGCWCCSGRAEVRQGLDRGSIAAQATLWARDKVNRPASAQSPAEFVSSARRLLSGTGVTVQVFTDAQLRAHRMGGVIGVGQGSERPPRFLKITYEPRGRAAGRLALVGKGVVFDSGGLSLKTASGMETMKTDMSGAAAVVATMSVLRRLGVKSRVTAYVPLVENMPSGNAIRPGDVLTIRNGKTVEVLNTDAEGRLILADALSLAVDDRADAIVDLATLTGACVVALGEKIAGLMGNHDGWSDAGTRRSRPGGGAGLAAPAAHRVPQAARQRGRRPPQRELRWLRRRTDRRNLPPAIRGRPAVGAPRHRGAVAGAGRRRLPDEGRNRVRRAHVDRAGDGVRGPRRSGERGELGNYERQEDDHQEGSGQEGRSQEDRSQEGSGEKDGNEE